MSTGGSSNASYRLHLGVDGSGVVVANALTGGHVDDATTAVDLIDTIESVVSCVTADAAYDTRGIYEAEGARGATVVIPPTRTAVWTVTTITRARPLGPAGWTATVEEGRRLPSAGPCGERLLPVQVDHRGEPSSAPSRPRHRPRLTARRRDTAPWPGRDPPVRRSCCIHSGRDTTTRRRRPNDRPPSLAGPSSRGRCRSPRI